MVERFGYSLDVGKSLENEKKSGKKEPAEQKVKEEPLETPKGEELSADSLQKDILDDIKEDIEVGPISAEEVDSSDELPVEETVSEEISADKIPLIIDDGAVQDEEVVDKKEELDEFEEPMPDEPEEEPEPEPQRPPAPEEEDVNEIVDKSFKEQNEAAESAGDKKGFGWWKWGAGIAVVLILAVIVYKLGFVGVVDNNSPASAVASEDDIDAELETFFENSDALNDVSAEEPAKDVPLQDADSVRKTILYADGASKVVSEAPEEPVQEQSAEVVQEKNPDELLDLLKQGLN